MHLITISLILILALVAIRLSDKLSMPQLLFFMILGVGFNFIGFEFNDFAFSEAFSSLALMFIIFYGGFGTKWKMTKPVAKEAITLSFLGTILTALITGAFVYFIFDFTLIEALLLGSIVGSTDYASVSSILQSQNLNLKFNTSSLLELESGSNDPTAFTMVTVCLLIMAGQEVNIPLLILLQVGLGIGLGFLMGYLFMRIIDFLNFDEGMLTIFLAATALFTYAFANQIGGNGYLAIYIFGIYVGNKEFISKRAVVFFFDGITNLAQIGLFFLLGFLSNPSNILQAMPVALVVMLFMTLVARPASVFALMAPFKLQTNQLVVISWAGLRGAAAIAFAIVAVNSGAVMANDLFHIVFDICLLSALIQGGLLPWLTRQTDMLDPTDSVLKTFNYYQDKSEIGFFQTEVKPQSHLVGKQIKDLNLEFDFILAKIQREDQPIVPKGDVRLQPGDQVILVGKQYFDPSGTDLVEFKINDFHRWKGKALQELQLPDNYLIVLVQRSDNEFIVPSGSTVIEEGDTVIALNPSARAKPKR
ncbi:potassium/proton antiporter [Hutsoniella sourekii]|uniref:potassium/proton antiporter n=1 Tax=Hutsoniella sourekii TaxID=87650 RepID=UPI0004831302|nr:potassium/proton antiporter [Hutsoniella sourekii]